MLTENERAYHEQRSRAVIARYGLPFLQVIERYGIDREQLGFGVCPVAHQELDDYPFRLMAVAEDQGTRLARVKAEGSQWYKFDELLSFAREQHPYYQGHEVVPVTAGSKGTPGHFISFFIHPLWPELHIQPDTLLDGSNTRIFHPLYEAMPRTCFRGGLALELAKRLYEEEYVAVIAQSGYLQEAIKYLEYMHKALAQYLVMLAANVQVRRLSMREIAERHLRVSAQSKRFAFEHNVLENLQ